MRLIGRGYLTFAWRYPELYRVMYGLDGVTFSVSEPEKEGLQIEDVVLAAVASEPEVPHPLVRKAKRHFGLQDAFRSASPLFSKR